MTALYAHSACNDNSLSVPSRFMKIVLTAATKVAMPYKARGRWKKKTIQIMQLPSLHGMNRRRLHYLFPVLLAVHYRANLVARAILHAEYGAKIP